MGFSLLILRLEFIKNTTKGKDKHKSPVIERRSIERHGTEQLEPPEETLTHVEHEQDSSELDVTIVECH